MDRLGRTDGREVAVALVGEDHRLGIQPLGRRSHGQRTPVSRLDPVDVDVVVGEDRTTYGRHAHRPVGQAQLGDDLGNEFMHRTVAAARTIVHDIVGDEFRFGINQILLFDFNLCHGLYFLISFSLSASSTSSGLKSIPP